MATRGPRLSTRDSAARRVWRELRLNPLAFGGLVIVVLIALLALFAPVLPIPNPDAVNPPARLRPAFSSNALLGTDDLGRDMLSRLIWGGRVSLITGLGTMLTAALIGVTLGLSTGYLGGVADNLGMRLTDIVMSFPAILLAIAIVAGLGPGLLNAMIAVALVGFPLYARLVRSMVLSLKEREYVESARALGATPRQVIVRHLLPNTLGPIGVTASLDVGAKIIVTASLSFLGLGTQPPTADWGSMLAAGRDYVTVAPHVAALPGVMILLTVLGFNLLGDALRDALDPRAIRSAPTL
ncbi:MAG: ABC transporter permease [Chloroflexi bacterium]|nr:ABC transporter permease [Chloroflexota bacterium]